MNKASVSFLICSYNSEKLIAKTLDSCLSQTSMPEKVLVADDCSSDSTTDIILEYSRRYPGIVELFKSDQNLGRANQINRLLPQVKSKYILMIDHDDIAMPNRVERQVDFMEKNSDVDICSSFVNQIDFNGNTIGKGVLNITTREIFSKFMKTGEAIGLYCSSVIIRTATFAEKKLKFRPQYWPADDIDMWNRASESGLLILAQPEFLTSYRVHAGSTSIKKIRETRSRYEFVRDSMKRRRNGKSERSYEEFLSYWNKRPILIRINSRRKAEAKAFYRAAGFLRSQHKYLSCIAHLSVAAVLQPSYTLPRLVSQLCKTKS